MPEKTQSNRNNLSPWTIAEIKFVEENYRKTTSKDIGELLGRSAGAVRQIAGRLGLTKVRPPDWTEKEHEWINMYYDKGKGIAYLKSLMPERTEFAIRIQASLIGVTNPSWSNSDRQYLEMHHGSVPISKIATVLGRSTGSVASMVSKMGLAKRPETTNAPWTEHEIEILRTHYAQGALITCVQQLLPGRTKGAISTQAQKMGIKKSQDWTAEDIEILRKFYSCLGTKVVEKLPHRTRAAIKTQARRLGLKQSRESKAVFRFWGDEEWTLLEKSMHLSIAEQATLFPDKTESSVAKAREQFIFIQKIAMSK
ncbi:hypothetical protein [Enterobacter asburiae]|uniref:hypothetical protein n=1 Tax=Enterobacter asburiae TaxID=61645 RepID=UPI0021D1B5E2|nr:hypothetical protein [Enterobacter asburiae]MCU6243895.1 hypothetical protein [Enterobacter asburiae]